MKKRIKRMSEIILEGHLTLCQVIIITFFIPLFQKRILLFKRQMAMRSIETKRKSRVISMIHRQETMSFLGIPFARYIDIEDSEAVLRAIRMTPHEMPLDLVLH